MKPLRPNLPPLIPRIAALPRDDRGFPIPWFVAYVDGKPEFRVADAKKRMLARRDRLCWVCGGKLGKKIAFVAGPMCGVNRVSSEPPLHCDCAEWSVQACPFLVNPDMVRREGGLPEDVREVGGIMIRRNPGVTLIWQTARYEYDQTHNLFRFPHPADAVQWWAEGRRATKAEVEAAIESGLPILRGACSDDDERQDLDQMLGALKFYLPSK